MFFNFLLGARTDMFRDLLPVSKTLACNASKKQQFPAT
jgi:hypothetical protein